MGTWHRGGITLHNQWQGLKEACFLSGEMSQLHEALGACRPTLSNRGNVISLGEWNGRAGTTFLVKCSLLSSRIVKISFERDSLGSKRADSWGLLWRVELSSLVDDVQAGFPVAQRWPGLQAPCAEAGSTSSPVAGPGAWEPGGGWGGHLCG